MPELSLNPSRRTALLAGLRLALPNEADSPFLRGVYAPVVGEICQARLEVEGRIPDHLSGSYLRNGPNPRFKPKGRHHWFDGDGMIHSVSLRPGEKTASYRCAYVRTAGFCEEERAGKALYPGLLELPDLGRMAAGLDGYKNSANTALLMHHGRLHALWEGGCPHLVNPATLETQGAEQFQGVWKGAFTAHPKVDPVTGELVFFGYGLSRPYLRMGTLDSKGRVGRLFEIELPRPVMMHDFAITRDYAVFLDMPQTFSLANLARGRGVFAWQPELGGRIGLVCRKTGKTTWFAVQPGSVFHTLNAWQDADTVVLIACRMPRFPTEALDGSATNQPLAERPRLWRYEMGIRNGKVQEEPLDDPGSDMPRLREDLLGKPTRFAYTLETDFCGWRKHDLKAKTTRRLQAPTGWACGEAVFVPGPGGTCEDDGHLLALVQPPGNEPGRLWVMDAATFAAEPVARVRLPRRVPAGFHGLWVAGV